jgi:hypothetical protein
VARDEGLMLTIAYKRAKSFTVAMNGLRFVVEYGRLVDRLGYEPTIEDYADEIGVSRSQAFRRQAAFRQCFPKDEFSALWGIVRPLLDASPFRNEHPRAQAVFVGSIKAKLSS